MTGSLLIVNDDRDQLAKLARRFIRSGFEVLSVAHPRQALEAASFRQFQVALLDTSLPEMGGIELMHRLKHTQDAMQVIILSGDDAPRRRAKAGGAFYCVARPYEMPTLEATVEAAFEQAVEIQSVHELAPSAS